MRWFLIIGIWIGMVLRMHGQTDEKISTFQAATLGFIQGITEFLPISSTGHMILANECIFQSKEQSDTLQTILKHYMICINLGTILVLLLFYRYDVRRIILGCFGKDREGFCLGWHIGLAFIPAGLFGFLLDDTIQKIFYTRIGVAIALIAGGVFIFWVESFRKDKLQRYESIYRLTTRSAVVIGLFQTLALWPGFSRSLATIVGGIVVGLSLAQAIHFSFLLGLLTASAATIYKFLRHGNALLQAMEGTAVWLGIFLAFIVGFSTIRVLFKYLQTGGLRVFGYYRILLGICLLL